LKARGVSQFQEWTVIPPLEEPAMLKAAGWDRATDAFLFEIPSSWHVNGVEIVAYLTSNLPESPSTLANNSISRTLSFVTVPPICTVYIPVRTTSGTPSCSFMGTGAGGEMIQRAKSLLPTARLWGYRDCEPIEKLDWCWGFIPCGYTGYDPEDDPNLLMAAIWNRHNLSDDPDVCDDANARTHYVGMLKPDGGATNGMGALGFDQMWFKLRTDTAGTYNGQLINSPYGGRTLAHELGHNYDRYHVDCGDPDDVGGNYPYDPCHFSEPITATRTAEYYGFDALTHTSIPANADVADLMSYGDPRWTSDYTWRAIYNELRGQLAQADVES
jgi:hypothetical protein